MYICIYVHLPNKGPALHYLKQGMLTGEDWVVACNGNIAGDQVGRKLSVLAALKPNPKPPKSLNPTTHTSKHSKTRRQACKLAVLVDSNDSVLLFS